MIAKILNFLRLRRLPQENILFKILLLGAKSIDISSKIHIFSRLQPVAPIGIIGPAPQAIAQLLVPKKGR